MTSRDTSWPWVVVSPLTESKGHLLRDDAFWFENLSVVNQETTIYTSPASATALRQAFPAGAARCREFHDTAWARRLSFRLFVFLRLMRLPKFHRRRVLVQAFDECSLLMYLVLLRRGDNRIALILTNNISPERFTRRPKLLAFMLRQIFKRVDVVFYHSDFEFDLARRVIGKGISSTRFAKLKYHLMGSPLLQKADNDANSQPWITFFGPASEVKPLDRIFPLIAADYSGIFRYRFVNLALADVERVRLRFSDSDRFTFENRYLSENEYHAFIRTSCFVFLPHNRSFEGKISGILSDCVANGVPVISDAIEPLLEFGRKYGQLGCIAAYDTDPEWAERFVAQHSQVTYSNYLGALCRCRESHAANSILREFLVEFP